MLLQVEQRCIRFFYPIRLALKALEDALVSPHMPTEHGFRCKLLVALWTFEFLQACMQTGMLREFGPVIEEPRAVAPFADQHSLG